MLEVPGGCAGQNDVRQSLRQSYGGESSDRLVTVDVGDPDRLAQILKSIAGCRRVYDELE
jgi:hypothetical protein